MTSPQILTFVLQNESVFMLLTSYHMPCIIFSITVEFEKFLILSVLLDSTFGVKGSLDFTFSANGYVYQCLLTIVHKAKSLKIRT